MTDDNDVRTDATELPSISLTVVAATDVAHIKTMNTVRGPVARHD
jgi:hypothetical protein